MSGSTEAKEQSAISDGYNGDQRGRERTLQRDERRALMMAVARREQSPLGVASTKDGLSLNHKLTTTYTSSIGDGHSSHNDENAEESGGHNKEAPSVVSYHSVRDLAQFVKDLYGRYFFYLFYPLVILISAFRIPLRPYWLVDPLLDRQFA